MDLQAFTSEVKTLLKPLAKEQERLHDEIERLNAVIRRGPVDGYAGAPSESLTHRLLANPEFKAFCESKTKRGKVFAHVGSLFEAPNWQTKTTIDSTAVGSSTPGILVPSRTQDIIPGATRRLSVRDLLTSRPTANNAVEFVSEDALTNNASYQVEANDKPESALTFTISSSPVRTLAHWIPASRQVLDDFAQLQSYLEGRLLYGLKYKEDYELLHGDGLGVHMTGLCVAASAYSGTYAASGDTYIDKLRKALCEVDAADELPADGIVLHPSDMMRIELTKTEERAANTGQYIVGSPSGTVLVQTLWGRPLVATNAMTEGRFLVGAFGSAAGLWDRMEAQIEISTEHSDYFIKNLVAIRAEERLALTVYRPASFRYGSF